MNIILLCVLGMSNACGLWSLSMPIHMIVYKSHHKLLFLYPFFAAAGVDLVIVKPLKNQSLEMLLGFIQTNGFDSSHGHRIDTVGQEFTWVPRK